MARPLSLWAEHSQCVVCKGLPHDYAASLGLALRETPSGRISVWIGFQRTSLSFNEERT